MKDITPVFLAVLALLFTACGSGGCDERVANYNREFPRAQESYDRYCGRDGVSPYVRSKCDALHAEFDSVRDAILDDCGVSVPSLITGLIASIETDAATDPVLVGSWLESQGAAVREIQCSSGKSKILSSVLS